MYEVLEGKIIRLRKAREDDYQSMLKHVWSDEAVYRWMLYQPTLTEEDAREKDTERRLSHCCWNWLS